MYLGLRSDYFATHIVGRTRRTACDGPTASRGHTVHDLHGRHGNYRFLLNPLSLGMG